MKRWSSLQGLPALSFRWLGAVMSAGRRIAGWWIGRRRGWTPDTRRYGAGWGYEIRYAGRAYWWDGERLTPIADE